MVQSWPLVREGRQNEPVVSPPGAKRLAKLPVAVRKIGRKRQNGCIKSNHLGDYICA